MSANDRRLRSNCRLITALLWAAPALVAAFMASVLLIGAAAGFLWLFVFGDNPWPDWVSGALSIAFLAVCICAWAMMVWLAYTAAPGRLSDAPIASRAVAPLTAAAVLVLLLIAHQFSVGNLGAPGDTVACSQLCLEKGFASSGTPPRDTGARSCTCFDRDGREAYMERQER